MPKIVNSIKTGEALRTFHRSLELPPGAATVAAECHRPKIFDSIARSVH